MERRSEFTGVNPSVACLCCHNDVSCVCLVTFLQFAFNTTYMEEERYKEAFRCRRPSPSPYRLLLRHPPLAHNEVAAEGHLYVEDWH